MKKYIDEGVYIKGICQNCKIEKPRVFFECSCELIGKCELTKSFKKSHEIDD